MRTAPQVLISEVGPRDGLQSVKATMATANKLRWIDALVASGLREIEVCSFVPAQHLPQMADAAEVVRHALTHPGVTIMALVPNVRGARAALQAGVHKLTIPVSASAAHSLANVRKTREEMIEEVRAIVRLCDDIAPGASGNVVTEDLVFMFEAMGVTTGVDLDKLMAARAADGRPAGRAALWHDAGGGPAERLDATHRVCRSWRQESDMTAPNSPAKPLPCAGPRVVSQNFKPGTMKKLAKYSAELLAELGYSAIEIKALCSHGPAQTT